MSDQRFRITENKVRTPEFIFQIMKYADMSEEQALWITAYNIITPLNLSLLTGRGISSIQNLMVPKQTVNGLVPTFIKVFPHHYDEKNPGPVFILFDQTVMEYIIKTLTHKTHGGTDKPNKGKGRGEPSTD